MANDDTTQAGTELRTVADKARGAFAFFRMFSGGFRSRIVSGLENAARMEDERRAFERDRAALQEALDQYRQTLKKARDQMLNAADETAATLSRAADTEERVREVQERALSLEDKARSLAEEDRRLLALSEELARGHAESESLLGRLEDGSRTQSSLLQEIHDSQARVRDTLQTADQRIDDLKRREEDVAARVREVSEREGAATSTEALQAAERERQAARDAQLTVRREFLDNLVERVEQNQAHVSDVETGVLERMVSVESLQREVEGRFAALDERHARQDSRDEELRARGTAQDERKLALDRERVDIDGRIERLKGLEKREQQLLAVKEHLDQEQKDLKVAFGEVRENQRRTLDTWEELKKTLQRLESLETRVQQSNETAEGVRAETDRRAQEFDVHSAQRTRELDERANELEMWRMEAQLRERKIQERFNELDVLEQRKSDVREQIGKLERDQARRIAGWEREQQRQRTLWAERRAEAEKARELYERNMQLLEKRLLDVSVREKEHKARIEELAEREGELDRRERELKALEIRVHELEEQRQSLNVTIAGLTARAGTGWSGAASRLGAAMESPPPAGNGGNGK